MKIVAKRFMVYNDSIEEITLLQPQNLTGRAFPDMMMTLTLT